MLLTYEVEMHAFADGAIRTVRIPEDHLPKQGAGIEEVLEAVFMYGQNDFQPQPMPSVSVGDVVRIPDGYGGWDAYRVEGAGWSKL
jgi:hypothetical protein